MSRTLLTLLATFTLGAGLAVAQDQPAQNPGQGQATPPSQQSSQPQQQPSAQQGQAAMSSHDLQAAFEKTFQRHPELSDVKVKVADDKIEFTGTVPTEADKEKVHRTAEAYANGRKVVDSDLKVAGGQSNPMSEQPPTGPRTTTPPTTPPPTTTTPPPQ